MMGYMGYIGYMGYMGWGFHDLFLFFVVFEICFRTWAMIFGGQYQGLVSYSVSYSTFEVDQHFKTCGMTILGLMVVLWYPFCTHKLTS